jgi:hypothetical protein
MEPHDPKFISYRRMAGFSRLRERFDAKRAAQLIFGNLADDILSAARTAGASV